MTNLTAAEILSTLDLAAVEAAILNDDQGNPALLAHQFEDVKKMCVEASNKWLVSDLAEFDASTVCFEEGFNIVLGGYPTRGFLDFRGQYRRGPYKGSVCVADWKTSGSELDLTWQTRLIDSKQWRLYSIVPPKAQFISYRGINVKGKTREVYLDLRNMTGIEEEVESYFSGVGDMLRVISTREVWPQNKPSACGMFNSICPFKADCDKGSAPRYTLPMEDISLSYSGTQRFLQCPERYRRIKKAEAGIDGSEATRIGSATHAGLEEIWRQSFRKYGT